MSKESKRFNNRLIVETFSYGTKYVDGFISLDQFANLVMDNNGYFITADEMIISSKEIKGVYFEYNETY